MSEKEYYKPQLIDLSDDEMLDVNGGVAVAVVPTVGLAVAAVLVAVGYSVLAGGVVVNVGGAVNLLIGANHVVKK